jgi:hypothetical protein
LDKWDFFYLFYYFIPLQMQLQFLVEKYDVFFFIIAKYLSTNMKMSHVFNSLNKMSQPLQLYAQNCKHANKREIKSKKHN